MKNKNYIGGFLAMAVLLLVGLACNQHGEKLEYNGGELYYTKNVTEADARKLGEYLVKQNFFDGKPKTVQLDKSGATYQFRMVVQKEKQTDEATALIMKVFAIQLSSEVFDDAETEVHVCDENLKTLRVIKP